MEGEWEDMGHRKTKGNAFPRPLGPYAAGDGRGWWARHLPNIKIKYQNLKEFYECNQSWFPQMFPHLLKPSMIDVPYFEARSRASKPGVKKAAGTHDQTHKGQHEY